MRNACATAAIVATVLLLRADDPDVIALLRKEIASHPGNTVLDVQLAGVLMNQERFDEARNVIQNALTGNASDSELHRANGDLLFREGRVVEAESEYNVAIQSDKDNALALYGCARVSQAQSMRAKAVGFIRTARALGPDNDEISREFDALEGSSTTLSRRSNILDGRHAWELGSSYRHYNLPCRVLLQRGRVTGMTLMISINGVKSELRVDTGADGVIVSSAFASKAGIQRIGGSSKWGIGSNTPVNTWTGFADELSIGDVQFRNVIVEVRDKGSIDSSGGLVGTDIFRRFLVKVDFRNYDLALDPLFGPAWDGYSPVDRYSGPETQRFAPVLQVYHYLLIPTLANGNQSLFLIDTGARFNNISTALARRVATVRKNHHMSINGVSGKVSALYEADRVLLQFAEFQQPALNLAAFDLSNFSRSAGMEVSGILGLPVLAQFQSLTIDYRDGGISFDYQPK